MPRFIFCPLNKKTIAASVAISFFAQNILFLHAAETSVWQERRDAVRFQKPSLLASLPAAQPNFAFPLSPKALSAVGISADVRLEKRSALVNAVIPPWLQEAVAPYATINAVTLSKNPRAKTILLVQDAHLHFEAQTNIAGSVTAVARALRDKKSHLLVGMEGADISVDNFSGYNAYPHRKELTAAAKAMLDSIEAATGPNSRRVIEAAFLEKSIDFAKVEHERAKLLETLVGKMTGAEVRDLVQLSAAFKAGIVPYAVYYDHLKNLASAHGVRFSQFPDMGLYVQYVLKTESVDTEALLAELQRLEAAASASLDATAAQRAVLALQKDFYSLKKMTNHTLTEDEWNAVEARLPYLANIPA